MVKNLFKKVVGTTLAATAAVAATPLVLPQQNTALAKPSETEGMVITAGFDMVFNGALTAVYTHRHNLKDSLTTRDFWESFGQGMFAGGVMWGGKELMFQTNQPGFPIIGKFLHSGGVSVRDNLMEGIGWRSRYQFDFGPARFSIEHMDTKPSLKVYGLVDPLVGFGYLINQGATFDPKLTLKTLTPVFTFDDHFIGDVSGMGFAGVTIGDVVGISKTNIENDLGQNILAHELIHTAQYRECSFLDVAILDYYARKGTLGKLPNFMLKHFRVGSDIIYPLLAAPNSLGKVGSDINPLELEAFYGYTKF